MSHKHEHVSTGNGFSVKNGETVTQVINQDGTLNGGAVIDNGSISAAKLASDAVETAKIKDANVTSPKLAESLVQYAEVTISAADIVATTAGKLGHAAGYPLVADPGATKVVELISAVLIYDYDTAAYTGGGNVSININGGAALTGVVSAANSLGAAADKIVQLAPLSTAGNALTANKGLNLVAAAAFTQPGTAAGVVRVKVAYRVHTHGLV